MGDSRGSAAKTPHRVSDGALLFLRFQLLPKEQFHLLQVRAAQQEQVGLVVVVGVVADEEVRGLETFLIMHEVWYSFKNISFVSGI